MKLLIIAGGQGIRLGLQGIPKPMVRIGSMPLLEHQINLAKEYGIEDIYILSGYLSETIVDYFGGGETFGVNITYVKEQKSLGTAGAVKQMEGEIGERFLVFYGDVLMNFDVRSFIDFDKAAGSTASIIVHPNDHPYDSDLVEVSEELVVTAFHSKPHDTNRYYRNLVNAAIYILSPAIFKYIPSDKSSDFGKDIFPLLLNANKIIRAYKSAEYMKDIGTTDRLTKANKDYLSGKVKGLSKKHRRPAIFLDRDGTVVEDVNLLNRPEDLKLYPFTSSAIGRINSSEHLSFLVTNQPVVARNLCSMEDVRFIHDKLETLLGRDHAFLDNIYFCPHHPDKGYPEENPIFKGDCVCRKPNTGMIERARDEYHVDIEKSWFIGDTTTDIQTGINAGMRTVLVKTGKGGKDGKYPCVPDFAFDDIGEAVEFILRKQQAEHNSCVPEIAENS